MRSLPTSVDPVNEIFLDAGIGEQRVRHVGGAAGGDDVDDTGGHAGLLHAAHDLERRERRRRGGLDDHRAARGEGRAELARHHRSREVPGRDRGGDADGLAQHEHPLLRIHRRQHLAVDALGLTREPLEERRGVDDLALGLGQRLALLVGHDAGDAIGLGEDPVGGAAEDAAALERGQRLPRAERLLGGVDRALHVLGGRVDDGADHRARRRVRDLEAPTVALAPVTADRHLVIGFGHRRHRVSLVHRKCSGAEKLTGSLRALA